MNIRTGQYISPVNFHVHVVTLELIHKQRNTASGGMLLLSLDNWTINCVIPDKQLQPSSLLEQAGLTMQNLDSKFLFGYKKKSMIINNNYKQYLLVVRYL